MTIETIISHAKQRNFESIAITDHVDVPEDRKRCEILARELQRIKPDIEVLVGCEIEAFETDPPIDEAFAATLDFVLIAPNHFHSFPAESIPKDTIESNAATMLKTFERAVSFPWVHAIAHPLILFEIRSGLDEVLQVAEQPLKSVMTKAAELSIAFEISPRALRTGAPATVASFYRMCADCGAKITVGTDAHSPERICHLAHVYPVMERAALTDSDILVIKSSPS